MSEIRKDCLYTKDHEWVKKVGSGRNARVGITDFAQASLGDVTFLQIPAVGTELKKGQIFGSVESVKAVSDLFAPVSGKVTTINEALVKDPAALNTKPFDDAWLLEIEISNESELSSLLSPEAYKAVAV